MPVIKKLKLPPDKDIISDKINNIHTNNTPSNNKSLKDKKDFFNDKFESQKLKYKTVKTSLKSIVKDISTFNRINKVVLRINRIIIHIYNFLKLYILYLHSNNKPLPCINNELIITINSIIFLCDARGVKSENSGLKDDLKLFFINHYRPLMIDDKDLSYTNLHQIINYEATSIITAISNHIQEHFGDAVNRIVNLYCNKDQFIENNKDNHKIVNDFLYELKVLKEDIMSNSNLSKPKYKSFKKDFKINVIKDNIVDDSFRNMIDSDPMTVLPYLINLSIYSETLGKNNLKDGETRQIKIINAFPLRTNIIPKYIDIDTAIVVDVIKSSKGRSKIGMLDIWFDLWSECFKMNKNVFRKKGYKFMRQISTDGVGCSILFIKEDYYKDTAKMNSRSMAKPKYYKEDIYVSDLTDSEKKRLLDLNIIGWDPGKIAPIFATNGKVRLKTKGHFGKKYRKTPIFQYTTKQRIHETKSDLFKKKQLIERKRKNIMINGNLISIEEIECKLSSFNSSTCIFNEFKTYIKIKLQANSVLIDKYEGKIWRKHKWFGYINRQKSEQQMINNFKKKFGEPSKVCILVGDWDERGKAVRGKPSTKGVGMRKIFKRAGYKDLYLVNEYNTSCRMYKSGEKMFECRNKRTPLALKMLTETKDCNLNNKTKNEEKEFEQINIISRDLNGSLNILLKGRCILEGKEIPRYMDITYRGTKYQK